MGRILVWFSCGAASAVAARLAVEKYGKDRTQLLYCDTLRFEHPDNVRFMDDVARWVGVPVTVLKSEKYNDIFDVFKKTGWLIGPKGARCTRELKINVRKNYQRDGDTHVFGFSFEEGERVRKFERENPISCDFILYRGGITKDECLRKVSAAGIALPTLYAMGYRNNNCIGCVKGGMGYWNKIRVDFPDSFNRMARVEREMGVSILKRTVGGKVSRLFLDELDPGAGRYESEPDIECGAHCVVSSLALEREQLELRYQ